MGRRGRNRRQAPPPPQQPRQGAIKKPEKEHKPWEETIANFLERWEEIEKEDETEAEQAEERQAEQAARRHAREDAAARGKAGRAGHRAAIDRVVRYGH